MKYGEGNMKRNVGVLYRKIKFWKEESRISKSIVRLIVVNVDWLSGCYMLGIE